MISLEKNKKSALILSTATIFSFVIADAILNLLLPYLLSGDIYTVVRDPENLKEPANLIGLISFLVVILTILILVGAFWLDRFFGEAYFGKRSLIRWSLFGLLFAFFLKVPEWIFTHSLWGIRMLFQLAGLFGAFFLARSIIPIQRKSGG
jgi:hypothetical protein